MHDYQARLKTLAELAKREGVKAVMLVPGSNLRYFTGLAFHLSERLTAALVTAQGEVGLVVPQLEAPQLERRRDLNARAFVWSDAEGSDGALKAALTALELTHGTLGADGMSVRLSEWLALKRHASALEVRALEQDLIRVRAIKTPAEIDAMRRAVAISEAALADLMRWLEPGMRERQIAMRLEQLLAEHGSEGTAFTTTVLSGPNSALPHGHTGERALREGEALLIDVGGRYEGYPADITRTFCLGEPEAQLEAIHEVVLAANEAGIRAAGPGVPMGEVDRAAREVIERAGYGEAFIHRTGHGLGLDVHEPIPQLAAGVTERLAPGMAFTVEPGIYLSGSAGVRLEDNLVVTEDGVEVLTSYPKRLAP